MSNVSAPIVNRYNSGRTFLVSSITVFKFISIINEEMFVNHRSLTFLLNDRVYTINDTRMDFQDATVTTQSLLVCKTRS